MRKNDSAKDSSRLSFLISYLYDEQKLKTLLKITGTKHDFTSMTPEEKNDFLNKLTKATHKQSDLHYGNSDKFYESVGYAIHGFSFKFKNLPNSLSHISNPSDNLNKLESNIEQAENKLTEELFSKKRRYWRKNSWI